MIDGVSGWVIMLGGGAAPDCYMPWHGTNSVFDQSMMKFPQTPVQLPVSIVDPYIFASSFLLFVGQGR